MRFFRKPLFQRESGPSDSANAADQLRADMSALEEEMTASMQALADIKARAAAAEARAMDAICAGDDHAARAAVVEQQAHAEKAAAIEADLKVLRAILDECYEFVSRMAGPSPPRA